MTAKEKTCILAVDDDPRVLKLEQIVLEGAGFSVATAKSGQEALDMVVQKAPTLVLLDVTMPGMDGFTVCHRIREFSLVPIIVVTARASEGDKLRGLELGADDYVTKPFSTKELVARVKAVLRRATVPVEQEELPFRVGGLEVDFLRRRVTLEGQELLLPATEYRLLTYLARNAGMVLTPDQILEHVWGEEYLGEHHLLRVAMARLRQKLGDDAKMPRYIQTRPGIGYTMPSG